MKSAQGDFKKWLEVERKMSSRSISDVVSRLHRISSIIDPLQPRSASELSFILSQRSEFCGYSRCVRSQLKRAATLYREYVSMACDLEGAREGK
jgi:hypothetical protein